VITTLFNMWISILFATFPLCTSDRKRLRRFNYERWIFWCEKCLQSLQY